MPQMKKLGKFSIQATPIITLYKNLLESPDASFYKMSAHVFLFLLILAISVLVHTGI